MHGNEESVWSAGNPMASTVSRSVSTPDPRRMDKLDSHGVEYTLSLFAETTGIHPDEGLSELPSMSSNLAWYNRPSIEQDPGLISDDGYGSLRHPHTTTASPNTFYGPHVPHGYVSFSPAALFPDRQLRPAAYEGVGVLPVISINQHESEPSVDQYAMNGSHLVASMHHGGTRLPHEYGLSYRSGAKSSSSPPWNPLQLRSERCHNREQSYNRYSTPDYNPFARTNQVSTGSYTKTGTTFSELESHGLSQVTSGSPIWCPDDLRSNESDTFQTDPTFKSTRRIAAASGIREPRALKIDSCSESNHRYVPTVTDVYSCGSPQGTQSQSTPSSHDSGVLSCLHDDCATEFRGKYQRGNLQRHMRLKHGKIQGREEKEYPCEASNCSKRYMRQDARLKHYRKEHPQLNPRVALRRK